MSNEKPANKYDDTTRRNLLYRVLLDEYERLEILTKTEVDCIRAKKDKAKKDY